MTCPRYHPLTPSYNLFSQRFQFTAIGMHLTTTMLKLLECVRLAPTGTSKVQTMLQQVRLTRSYSADIPRSRLLPY